MGEKFKDFPCFYYLENRVNKKNRIQFYSMLASMFGQTPEQAAQNSELFAHASGKLFGGTGYSIEEIQANASNYFEKPYKDCRGFYRRKAFDEAGLKDGCCSICPYSNSYVNACLEQERQILRILMEQRDLLGLTDCSTSDFKSKLAISCSNDLSEYPIIPFHAYLFDYLVRNDGASVEDITLFVSAAMAENGLFVSDELLVAFVGTQIGIISRIELPGGDRTSALLYALSELRDFGSYVPPQLVYPSSKVQRAPQKKSSNADELARLFADIVTVKYVPPHNSDVMSEELYVPTDSVSEAYIEDSADRDEDTRSVSSLSVARMEEDDSLLAELFMSIPVAGADNAIVPSCSDKLPGPSTKDSCTENRDESLNTGDVLYDTGDAPVDFVFQSNIDISGENTDDVVASTTEILSDIPNADNISVDDEMNAYQEGAVDDVSTVVIESYSDNLDSLPSDDGDHDGDLLIECPDDEPLISGEENDNDISSVGSLRCDTCCVCHGTLLENYPYSEDWMRGLYRHCIACENAAAKDNEKPFYSSALTHPVISTGCAFSNNEPETDCIYGDVPMTLSEEFASIISDCSDYACSLSNLVSFIEACDTASSASVECVNIYGIDGLLFYVTGAYYFIGGGTSACAAMKKLFSNADKLKLYSLNPLLVHVKLLRFGLRHVKIESLAVKYSVFVGTDLLLPPSVMFVTGDGSDMYRTIMPQYEKLFERTVLTGEEEKKYEKLMRLEWALAASVDTSFIALGSNRSVYGSNALNYRFSLLDVGRICREGTLYVVTLDDDSKIPLNEEKLFWEDVAGRLASSSLSCMNYSFILGLGKGISYFTCFEEEAFFDSLMASARSAYKKAYKREVHLQVTREKYVTY